MSLDWHDSLPEAEGVLDIISKALLLRGEWPAAKFSPRELEIAAEAQAEYGLDDDGNLHFRVVPN